ncbi:hypothetical protein, partial [uncultured Methanomethylovorans sp.]|uniref:hypothetical protein n=1 Tax=uncultured Methanomethylovorans sp. TaxID=183759 RepID=UPI002635327C
LNCLWNNTSFLGIIEEFIYICECAFIPHPRSLSGLGFKSIGEVYSIPPHFPKAMTDSILIFQ